MGEEAEPWFSEGGKVLFGGKRNKRKRSIAKGLSELCVLQPAPGAEAVQGGEGRKEGLVSLLGSSSLPRAMWDEQSRSQCLAQPPQLSPGLWAGLGTATAERRRWWWQ